MKGCPSCGETLRFVKERDCGLVRMSCDMCELLFDCCPGCFEILNEVFEEDREDGWGY